MTNIVVIDDDVDVCALLERHLAKRIQGSHVTKFGQAQLALDHLLKSETQTHLVLVDIGLPDFSGFEFIARVRADEKIKEIPIIVLTARTGLQDQARAIDVGADEFIEKPFSLQRLEEVVRLLLSGF